MSACPPDAARIESTRIEVLMASTSVHLPPAIVEQLDRLAARVGTSRNRVILRACEALLAEDRGDWPAEFFHVALDAGDLEELRAGGQDMEAAILAARHDREVPPL